MHEEQIQTSEAIQIQQESVWQRTHKAVLAGSLAVASAAYVLSDLHEVPRSDTNILDISEHAAHLAPGIAFGYGFKALVEQLPARIKNYATAFSIAGVTIVASLFETQVSDVIWYRNTTKDINDVYYTVAAGIIGALCLRSKSKQRPL